MADVCYRELLLETLGNLGGRAHRMVVLQSIHRRLAGRLSPDDYGGTPGRPDYPAWEHQVDGARQWLKDHLYLKSGSPRGVWELSARGRAQAKRARH